MAEADICGTCGANRADRAALPPDHLAGSAGGFCPECHAPNYGGPDQRAARPRHPTYGNFQLFDSASGKCVAEGSFPGALASGDTIAGSLTIDFVKAE